MRSRLTLALVTMFLAVSLTAMAEVPLPEALKAFPMYDGAVVQQSMNMGEGVFAVLQLPGGTKTNAVVDFYKKYFKGAGWATEMELMREDGGVLSFSKGNEQVMVNVDTSDPEAQFYTIMRTDK